ncbi:hypothetical protein GHK92_15575 [Nocardioides sp. dk4132]|uniref:hypothetical protein n=1 Tax=unclassified Nocardioides TaxID=2615069 RepID=UPI001297AAC5|nr:MULTISPECIES: hypothetical protein [unclassified Nocardioides]MQW77293.1 hypothetical protein [Nocardioides sp. dk4132]QGA08047.1 hypothetical protein GFH29_12050 [Nocardioides sp. dk884]
MCIALVIAAATYLAVLVTSAVAGDRAWRQGDHATAERWFRVGDRIDVVERWKAPYDVGVAVYSQGRWLEAAELFARARADVPQHSLCRVALNEALALEVLGDHLEKVDDPVGAKARWAQAQQVLAEVEGCSADAAEAEDSSAEEESSSAEEPSPSDTEDGDSEGDQTDEGDGDSEGDQTDEGDGASWGEGKPSEADQLQEATRRLQEKLSGAPRKEGEPQPETSPEDKAAQLEERVAGAARRRAADQDHSAPAEGQTSDRPTW